MEMMLMCSEPEHDEKLKLFCETDQKLVCVICRDREKHKGHVFKSVQEAAQIRKGKLQTALAFLAEEIGKLDFLIQKQETEITKTEDQSKTLLTQISAKFEQMHHFLRQKEDEVKKQLKKEEKTVTERLQKNLSLISSRCSQSKQDEDSLQSAMAITQSDQFLQWWVNTGKTMTSKLQTGRGTQSNTQYISRIKDLSVLPGLFFLGPLETHLEFFVWKEMLGSIKPVPETLTLNDPRSSYLKVSPGGARVRQTDRVTALYKDYNPGTVSEENFQTGQHYWEIEVGEKPDWSVGIKTGVAESEILLHLKHNKGYVLSCCGEDTTLNTQDKPQKIGLYLDCDRQKVSFYNADNMSLLVEINHKNYLKKPCCLSLVPGLYLDGLNCDPLTVCSYTVKR